MGRPKELTEEQRADLTARGYRPFELWAPDLSDPAVRAQAVEEAQRIAHADSEESILDWIELIQKDTWEGEDQR